MAHQPHDDESAPVTTHRDGPLYGVLAEFDTPGELVAAARKVRDAGYKDFDCFSPFPVHGIDEAMGIKRTILPLLIFGGGFAGTIGGILLQWWTNAYNWPWNISGKPDWSIPANIPIAFETTILLSVFTAFFGMWILNKLPQVWHPFFRLDRFGRVTDDAFLLGIEARDERFDAIATERLLRDAGALEVERCYLEGDPTRKMMPRWLPVVIVSTTAFALIPFAIAAKARNAYSSEPHIHIFPDMDFQPKYKADTASDLFPDGRANRGQLPGTVARGALAEDDFFFRGLDNGQWALGFPSQVVINQDTVGRGKERFNIYCAPCHGYDGRGDGPIPKRLAQSGATWQARNLVEAPNAKGDGGVAIKMPNGQMFNTISNGYNTMMGYAAQLSPADRWAIVLYVRALQRAANASYEDVPAAQRDQMMAPLPAPASPPADPAPAAGSAPSAPAGAPPAPKAANQPRGQAPAAAGTAGGNP